MLTQESPSEANRAHPLLRMLDAWSDTDRAYSDAANRERGDEEPPPWVIDGLLPIGASVLIADPGAGKSMITQQMLHHVCYGRPLGDWDAPAGDGGQLAWVIDLEGDAMLTRERSYSITPYGVLTQDGRGDHRDDHWIIYTEAVIPPVEREAYLTYKTRADAHTAYVDTVLTDARAAGRPITLLVIDTLTKFMGPRPASSNAYEWEADVVGALNRLGQKHECAVLIIHHTNKAGEISGSTGIGGSVTVSMKLEISRDEPDQGTPVTSGVLRSSKVRGGAPFAYPVVQCDDGTWTFTDTLGPDEASSAGWGRRILTRLRERGPQSRRELADLGAANSLGKVLDRLRRRNLIVLRYGRWQLAETEIRTKPGLPETTCDGCGERLIPTVAGQRRHPTCPVPAVVPADDTRAAGGPDQDNDQADEQPDETGPDAEPLRVNGFQMLKDSIEASRMHPVPVIRKEKRDQPPWRMFAEWMTGEHRWEHPRAHELAAGQLVAVLDRAGSYPSAAGSTPVAANVLTHTGPLPAAGDRGGLFAIEPVAWTDERIGHPLGRIADRDADVWMVTTPHIRFLEKLAKQGYVDHPVIVDSWTGRATAGLFTAFSKAAQDARLNAKTPEEYIQVKRTISIAIRGLWPKEARSPFWRPDWSLSVRAEAAVRHWARARDAVHQGATLLRLGSVDEAVFIAPADADSTWCPPPYVAVPPGERGRYGHVSHKTVHVAGDDVPSPLAGELWARRGVKGRRSAQNGQG